MAPSVRAALVVLLLVAACTEAGTESSPLPPGVEEGATTGDEGTTLSDEAEAWCVTHFGGVNAAASRMPRGAPTFEIVDETPPAVRAANSLNQPPERLIELWKEADLASWNSNCASAYEALGDIPESSWRFCHDNASELGSVAYSMGFADVVSGSLRAELEQDIESSDEDVRTDGYSQLALFLWLVDFDEWEQACRAAHPAEP